MLAWDERDWERTERIWSALFEEAEIKSVRKSVRERAKELREKVESFREEAERIKNSIDFSSLDALKEEILSDFFNDVRNLSIRAESALLSIETGKVLYFEDIARATEHATYVAVRVPELIRAGFKELEPLKEKAFEIHREWMEFVKILDLGRCECKF